MKTKKRFLSILLSLALMLGVLLGMSFTAYAETPYVSVSTYDGLIAAISDGNNVRLISDIEVTSSITVSSQIIIDGAGHKLTSQGTGRAFLVSGTLVLKDLTVSGFTNYGGGAISNSGTLVLNGCTFSGNSSPSSSGGGGAIENKNTGKLYAADTVFTGNYTGELGGAINNYRGSLYLTQCTFTQNYTTANNEKYGGAIGNNSNGDVRIINCTFSDNYYDYNNSKKRSDLGVYQTPTNYTIVGCAGINITPSSSGLTTAPYGTALLDYSDLNNIKLLYEASESSQIYSIMISGGANAATSGGNTNQVGLTGAMTTVTYTANTGYYFAEFADISSNGITARRTSSTVVTVSGTPTADATITVPDAVEKTAATVKKAPTAKNLTYNGQAQELITAGEASGGTMQYALGTATEATEQYTTSIPAKTEAGTYYVWYKAVGDGKNYRDSAASCVAASIASVDSGSDDPKKGELVYSGSAQKLVKGGSAVGGTMKYALGSNASTAPQKGWSANVPQGTNAGTYYVWYRVDGDQNHNSTKPACVTVTIRKAPAPKTLSDKQKAAALARVYNGKAQTLVKAPAALPTGYTKAQYSTDGGKTWSAVLPKGTKAGSYTVRVKYVGDKNHIDFTYGPLSAPIAKAKITIAAQDKKTTRGDALAKLTYMVSGAYVSGDSLGIKVSTTAKKAAKAGKYPINVSWNGNKNYSATLQKGTYTLGDAILPAEKKEARNLMDAGLRVDWDSSGVLVKWGGAPDAESYEVWAGYCGNDSTLKKVRTLGADQRSFLITSLDRKKPDPEKFISVTVKAYRKVEGKNTEIMHTIYAHVVINTNPKYTNAAKVTLPGTTFSLKTGGTAKIKASEVLANKKKMALSKVHIPRSRFRYESTKPSVASVDENGTVTAVGKGTCTVYVYALNCRYGKITVTVK